MMWRIQPATSQHVTLLITIYKFMSQANAWRKVEGVKVDRHISRKRKGNVLGSCVTPVYMNAQETMALTETQQENLHVYEKQPGKNNRGS